MQPQECVRQSTGEPNRGFEQIRRAGTDLARPAITDSLIGEEVGLPARMGGSLWVMADESLFRSMAQTAGMEDASIMTAGRRLLLFAAASIVGLFLLIADLFFVAPAAAVEPICPGGSNPRSDIVWCAD